MLKLYPIAEFDRNKHPLKMMVQKRRLNAQRGADMKKVFKILMWVVGGLVVLLLAATIVLKLYLTKDKILAWVTPPLEERLHRKVSISDAGAGLAGIYLDGLDVRTEGAAKPLVAASAIKIRWNLLSLLSKRLEIEDVRLVEPRIHVVRMPDGTLDIDDLLKPSKEPTKPAETRSGGIPVEVVISLFSMENGQVSLEDRTETPLRTYVLDEIDSRITDITLDRPLRYELSARLPLAEKGRFSAEGTVNLAASDMKARITVDDLDLPSFNPVLKGGTQFASGVLGVDLNLALVGGEKADLRGGFNIAKLALAADGRSGQPTDIKVDMEAGADQKKGTAVLRRLRLEAAGQALDVTGEAKNLKSRPRFDFRLASPELRIDSLAAILPPENGKKGARSSQKTAPAGRPPKRATPSVPFDAFGDVKVDKLLAGGIIVENFSARIELNKGVLQIRPAGASVYGGKLEARVLAEVEKSGPPFDTNVALAGTKVGELLAGYSPKLQNIMTGALDMSLKAGGRGGDLAALRSELKAEVKDGKIFNHPMVIQLAQMFKTKELETINFYSLRADAKTGEGVARLNSLILDGPKLQATGKGTVGLLDENLDLTLTVGLPRNIAARLVNDDNVLDAITDKQGWSRLPLRISGKIEEPSYGLDSEELGKIVAKVVEKKATKAIEKELLKDLPAGDQEKGTVQDTLRKFLGQ